MWGNKKVEGWKCLQSGKRMQMTLGLGIEVTASVFHLASRMVGVSSTDKREFIIYHNSSLFDTLSFYMPSRIGLLFNSEKGNKIAYAQNSGSASSMVSQANYFQDPHGILTVRTLYCEA